MDLYFFRSIFVFSRKQGRCEEWLIGPLDQVDRLEGINLGSVYLPRDDATHGANLQCRCYSWWPSCIRSNLKGPHAVADPSV